MTASSKSDWITTNQAYLLRELTKLKCKLRHHAGCESASAATQPPRQAKQHHDESSPTFAGCGPALELVTKAFCLSPFERDILLLCAGVELDKEFAPLCAAAQGDPSCPYPTFSLALTALPDPHWSALLPNAPLRRWRLIEPAAGPALTVARLGIDERVMHCLAGISHLDERLAGLIRPIEPARADGLVPSHAALAARIVANWSTAPSKRHAPIVQLCGDPMDCRPIAACVARALGLPAAVIDTTLIPSSANELEVLLRLLEREIRLGAIGVFLLETEDAEDTFRGAEPRSHAIARLAGLLDGLVLLSERERRRITLRPSVAFDVGHPLLHEQREAWRMAVGAANGNANGAARAINAICGQFNLSLASIGSISAEALTIAGAPLSVNKTISPLWELCRARLRVRLDGLAQRIESASTWDDLVLPDGETRVLRTIAAQLRQRVTVYEHWGFAAKSSRGLGISALFAGPSGTGKTMAAEVLANELCLDLYRIDLSSVVSKYIGETEKNLRRVFDAAEESGAILLFDEADALFGKRSEVKDSHDRYANIEVSYLLQRMEAYRGLAILTTNMKSALDLAFLRRIRFVVQFPFPDEVERVAIWKRIFPASTPKDGLDFSRLAKLRIAGGNIRNIALNAAFLAADAGEPVRMTHLMAAASSEYAKMERPLTAAEMGG
ncbi:MAG: ATP-binding protein [Pseudomonadota bacterium]|nr:ATP-binding protein [Pseudomonadota bacterium]